MEHQMEEIEQPWNIRQSKLCQRQSISLGRKLVPDANGLVYDRYKLKIRVSYETLMMKELPHQAIFGSDRFLL